METETKTKQILRDTEVEIMHEGAKKEINELPISYVLWLTFRSQFIDELAKTDVSIYEKWKEYENLQLDRLEREYSHVD
jgi:hypothetical protein